MAQRRRRQTVDLAARMKISPDILAVPSSVARDRAAVNQGYQPPGSYVDSDEEQVAPSTKSSPEKSEYLETDFSDTVLNKRESEPDPLPIDLDDDMFFSKDSILHVPDDYGFDAEEPAPLPSPPSQFTNGEPDTSLDMSALGPEPFEPYEDPEEGEIGMLNPTSSLPSPSVTSKQERLLQRRQSNILAKVMDKGGQVTAQADEIGPSGITPLHRAAREGDLPAVNFLLEQQKHVTAKARNGAMAIHDAVSCGHLSCVRAILSHEPSLQAAVLPNGVNLIHLSALFGQIQVIAFLAETCSMSLTTPASNGSTALHYCALGGRIEGLNYILPRVPLSHVDTLNSDGVSALHRAIGGNHVECVRRLIQSGADHTLVCQKVNGIQRAVRAGHLEVVRFLLTHDPSSLLTCAEDGASLWHFAAGSSHDHVIRTLFHEADMQRVDVRSFWADASGNSPAHDAASVGALECLKVMAERRMPLSASNHDLQTPADVARTNHNAECAIFITLKASS
eukprot:m.360204 g.360204  ORF g.360204 m.360204 type:complete len:507 (-) comp18922_c0_seq1:715-2235(-)